MVKGKSVSLQDFSGRTVQWTISSGHRAVETDMYVNIMHALYA